MEVDAKLELLGLGPVKVKETMKNASLTGVLVRIIDHVLSESTSIDKTVGKLIYVLATKLPKQFHLHLELLSSYLASKKIDQEEKLTAAIKFVQNSVSGDIEIAALEEFCGVGVTVTEDQIESSILKIITEHKDDLLKQRYRFNIGPLMAAARTELKWADSKKIKDEFEIQRLTLLGAKTEEDLKPVKAVKKGSEDKAAKKGNQESKKEVNGLMAAEAQTTGGNILELLRSAPFHKPGENHKTDGYVITPNTHRTLEEHLKITGGKVRTRFPPEPNGILHIGHAKAININFGYAVAHNGTCNLRYDDTNPEKEEEKFFIGIKDMVNWLGYTPTNITHSSDNFDQLYQWAVELIKKGLAYVCHQKPDEVKGRNVELSPWRERPSEESLQLFEDMKRGKFDEGQATLRLKLTLEEGKVDPIAYRIKYCEHHRTGNAWCIYPTYDYTHCLCDSIEHITHSLCTKEFQSRRSSYYWLCNALNIYCPVQWEYGRLNMHYTVVSKRKIAKLIDEGIVSDWDDPRLFTLSALRRRGFPAPAINRFCATLGLTGAQITIHPQALEAVVRDVLNSSAHRTMVVLEPIKVTITNWSGDLSSSLSVPNVPDDETSGTHSIAFSSEIYIERADFREDSVKGYRRLTPTQSVGLRYAGVVLTVQEVLKEGGVVCGLKVTLSNATPENKPKAFIHWVSKPLKCEVRLYENLFMHESPEDTTQVPGGYLTDINPSSMQVNREALCDAYLLPTKVFTSYQFERVGFFSVDPDSKKQCLVFNRTVTLKEDRGKI